MDKKIAWIATATVLVVIVLAFTATQKEVSPSTPAGETFQRTSVTGVEIVFVEDVTIPLDKNEACLVAEKTWNELTLTGGLKLDCENIDAEKVGDFWTVTVHPIKFSADNATASGSGVVINETSREVNTWVVSAP